MSAAADPLAVTLGVEEEFFLVDPETRDLVVRPDPGFLEECERRRGPHKIVPELLNAQVETNTRVCGSVAEARDALRETRAIVIEAAAKYGMAPMAASTHPFAAWRDQEITPRERYKRFAVRFQDVVRRFLVGGMHVHAGFGDPDSRVRAMTAMRRHLPLLNALSGSSPFGGGRDTGFKSWRLGVVGALPRSGIPRPFASMAEYERLLDAYKRREFIDDGSELWWDIRPSHAYPTVEMRICDICPRIDDAVAIVALYAALVRRSLRLDRAGALPEEPETEIVEENRWLARRYGVFAFLGAEDGGREDIQDALARLVEEVAEDAAALGCEAEVRGALSIVRDGAAADRQIDLYRLRRLEGDSGEEALRAVVDLALAETREGVA